MNVLWLWLSTTVLSYGIEMKTVLELFKYIIKNGYKINPEGYDNLPPIPDEVQQELDEDNLKMVMPLYNLIYSMSLYHFINNNLDELILALETLNIIQKRDDLEEKTYQENPTLLTALSIEESTRKAIKDKLVMQYKYYYGDSTILYNTKENNKLDIYYVEGEATRFNIDDVKDIIYTGYYYVGCQLINKGTTSDDDIKNLIGTPIEIVEEEGNIKYEFTIDKSENTQSLIKEIIKDIKKETLELKKTSTT